MEIPSWPERGRARGVAGAVSQVVVGVGGMAGRLVCFMGKDTSLGALHRSNIPLANLVSVFE